MIKTLDDVVIAEESKVVDFSVPVPAGLYTLKLLSVGGWEPNVVKSIVLKSTGETLTNVTVYNCNLKFEIVGGEHAGRFIFDRLTTHPNIPWSISGFLHGAGVSALKPSEIKSLEGIIIDAYIKIAKYDKKVVDKESGLEFVEEKLKNEVTRYKANTAEDFDI